MICLADMNNFCGGPHSFLPIDGEGERTKCRLIRELNQGQLAFGLCLTLMHFNSGC